MTIIFSIETSCDETSVAIVNELGKIICQITFNQLEHKKFGGVVPEIASRAHLQILQKIIPSCFKKTNLNISDIDLFCATSGPGLIGGLLVGTTIAKSMAIGTGKPFYPINHLEGHLISPAFNNELKFPSLILLLTGGHTQLYLTKKPNDYELLGETIDDAIGESFDKVAKLIGLPYPGGPEIEKLALKGNSNTYALPHPLKNKKNINFSFSGIKTAVSLIVKKQKKIDRKFKENIAASFQNKIIEIIITKVEKVLKTLEEKKINIYDISIVGGVAANKKIRNSFSSAQSLNKYNFIYPPIELCGDNAAMIALACQQKYKNNVKPNTHFKASPRLSINEMNIL